MEPELETQTTIRRHTLQLPKIKVIEKLFLVSLLELIENVCDIVQLGLNLCQSCFKNVYA